MSASVSVHLHDNDEFDIETYPDYYIVRIGDRINGTVFATGSVSLFIPPELAMRICNQLRAAEHTEPDPGAGDEGTADDNAELKSEAI